MSQPSLFADLESGPPKGALLSPDRVYRYKLWRTWDTELTHVNFVMLNPSTADERDDDNTIRKCVGYAKRWGHGGIVVTNLFAYRATDPDDLAPAEDPVGPRNDDMIHGEALSAGLVVCAWGAFKGYTKLIRRGFAGRPAFVRRLIHRPCHALRLTKNGEPGHPLFLPSSLDPIPFGD